MKSGRKKKNILKIMVLTKEISDAWVKYDQFSRTENTRLRIGHRDYPIEDVHYRGDKYGNLIKDKQHFDALKKRKKLQNLNFARYHMKIEVYITAKLQDALYHQK